MLYCTFLLTQSAIMIWSLLLSLAAYYFQPIRKFRQYFYTLAFKNVCCQWILLSVHKKSNTKMAKMPQFHINFKSNCIHFVICFVVWENFNLFFDTGSICCWFNDIRMNPWSTTNRKRSGKKLEAACLQQHDAETCTDGYNLLMAFERDTIASHKLFNEIFSIRLRCWFTLVAKSK